VASAQVLRQDIPLPELEQTAEAMSDTALTEEVAAWVTRVEELRDAAATLADEAAPDDQEAQDAVAAAKAAQKAGVARLAALVEILGGRDISAPQATALLTEQGSISVSTLELSTLQALAERWILKGRTWLEEDLPGLLARIVAALFVLLGFRLAAWLATRLLEKALSSARLKVSPMLSIFFVSITGKVIMVFGLLFALAALGVELGPLLAGVGVAGFVIGFALQDTLANFAAGVMILLYRPFEMEHLVTVGGVTGTVDELSLVSTTLLTPDHQRVVLPNNTVWGGMIINMSSQPARRADTTVGISYGDDIDQAIRAMTEVAVAHPLVLKTPATDIIVSALGESSVDITVRPWTKPEDYLRVTADLRKQLKQRLDKEGISIPFPQRDVHLIKQD
jgi:small conductance mechanosensitive channel